MKLILHNPFRILLLPVTADEASIKSRITDLTVSLALNDMDTTTDRMTGQLLGRIDYTPELLNDIRRQLSTDIDRVFHSLFWFERRNALDEDAFRVLEIHGFPQAQEKLSAFLNKQRINAENFSNFKNLALLYLSDPSSISEYRKDRMLKGIHFFIDSFCFFAADGFFQYIPGTSYLSEIEELRLKLIKELAAFLKQEMEAGRLLTAQEILGAISADNPSSEGLRIEMGRELSSIPLDMINRNIAESERKLTDNKANGLQLAMDLLSSTYQPYLNSAAYIPEMEYNFLSDRLAEQLRQFAMAYYRDQKDKVDIQEGAHELEELLGKALLIAKGDGEIGKIHEALLTINKYRTGGIYQRQLATIRNKRPENIYKASHDEIEDMPTIIDLSITEFETLLARVIEELGPFNEISPELARAGAIFFNNWIQDFVSFTLKYKDVIKPWIRIAKLPMPASDRQKIVENIKIAAKQADTIREESGCLGGLFLLLIMLLTVYLIIG